MANGCASRVVSIPHRRTPRGSWLPRWHQARMAMARHGPAERSVGAAALRAAVEMPQLSTPLAPPPTNRLDTGLPFVYMAGSGASQRRPVIICLVEKGVRPTAQLSLAARAHTRCARGRALRCGVLLSSRDSEFRGILTRMAPSAGLAMDFHSHTRSRCHAGTAGPSAYRTP